MDKQLASINADHIRVTTTIAIHSFTIGDVAIAVVACAGIDRGMVS